MAKKKTNKKPVKKSTKKKNSKKSSNKSKKKTKKKTPSKKQVLNNARLPLMKKSETYKKKIIILFSLVVILGTIIILMNLSMNFEKPLGECSRDSDCVRVQTTCCPCSSGGKEVCVPKSEKEKYEVNFSECQEQMICAQVYNCNPGTCNCVQGNCTFNIKE